MIDDSEDLVDYPAMGQFNIRLEDSKIAALDALAAKRGWERPELTRRMVDELLSADEQGRALFDRSQDLDPRMLGELVQRVAQGMIEFDRKLADIAKREAEIAKLRFADTELLVEMRKDYAAKLPERLKDAYAPFRADIEQLKQSLNDDPRLAGINSRLDRIETFARVPRNETIVQLTGIKWLERKLLGVAAALWSFGFVSFFALGVAASGWFGYPSANKFLGGGSSAICNLANYQLRRSDCRMILDAEGRTVLTFEDDKPPIARK
jgi:hypothetical protein